MLLTTTNTPTSAAPELLTRAADFAPQWCFCNTVGAEVKGSSGKPTKGAYQNLIALEAIACDAAKVQSGENIPVADAWGGRVHSGQTVYACVQDKTGLIISGLSDNTWADAKDLPCTANDSTLHQIQLQFGSK